MLIGLVGRFWTASGGVCVTDAARFRGPQQPGTARAAWNFSIARHPSSVPGAPAVLLATETRVQASDAASRRRFHLYWLVIRPFSGLIRRDMLRAIKREAEKRSTG
jgi:hypothetical protein